MCGTVVVAVASTAAIGLRSSSQGKHSQVLPGPVNSARTLLHNGWYISPAGEHHVELGDLILSAVVSPDGRFLAAVNGGAADHRVSILDTTTGALIGSAPVPRAQATGGLAFAPDGRKLYVSGANAGRIYTYLLSETGKVTPDSPLLLPGLKTVFGITPDPGVDAGRDPAGQDATERAAYLAGIALSTDGAVLYSANLAADSISAIRTGGGDPVITRHLEVESRPGYVALSKDGRSIYVALLGRAAVLQLDSKTMQTISTIHTGAHPNALLITGDGSRLAISCGNDDSVYIVNTKDGVVRDKINMRLSPRSPCGSTPSALAISPDQSHLFVVNSDNNDVAVVNIASPGAAKVEGYIPTTWYPTAVAVSSDGKRLFVGCGKGRGVGPNNHSDHVDPIKPAGYPYIVTQLKGIVSTIAMPDASKLAAYTSQVLANSHYSDSVLDRPAGVSLADGRSHSSIPGSVSEKSPIRHVLYIIKENRTYDQVLGDLKDNQGHRLGNGDANLCLFGDTVTPNHHALAREFVTLDNLYADGEVSVDGHHWSNAAYVPDTMQRTWPSEYGSKGGTPIKYGDFGDPLAETPSGRIWDLCERAGIDYETYYYHVDKRRSDAWHDARNTHKRDYECASIFVRDMANWSSAGKMPGFIVMALSEDHTTGTRPGTFTPQAAVASNDLALGRIVDACSHSPFWKDMAIFVIEDDAQNGADHVDAHRTVGLAISPYTRKRGVDSTHYTTCSFLRSMELILGLPPMSQYDASATPLYRSFGQHPDLSPYLCLPAKIDVNLKNGSAAFGAQASLKMDLSEPDRLTERDEVTLNRILWHSIKGPNRPYPGPGMPSGRDNDD